LVQMSLYLVPISLQRPPHWPGRMLRDKYLKVKGTFCHVYGLVVLDSTLFMDQYLRFVDQYVFQLLSQSAQCLVHPVRLKSEQICHFNQVSCLCFVLND
jgi:hypothetical protein